MIATTDLSQCQAVDLFVAALSKSVCKKGRDICEARQIRNVRQGESGFSADFETTDYCTASATFEQGMWQTECSCHSATICRHVAALFLTIAKLPAPPSSYRPGIADSVTNATVATVTPRQLTREQTRFLDSVRKLYDVCIRPPGRVKIWDLVNLGLKWPGFGWDPVPLCPKKPKDEFELWNFVAYTAQKIGVPIPHFMQPLTDLSQVSEKFADLERVERVQMWKERLLMAGVATANEASRGQIELRVKITRTWIFLLWRNGPEGLFKTMTQTESNRLYDHSGDEIDDFSEEANEIWGICARNSRFRVNAKLDSNSDDADRIVAALLSRTALRACIVNESNEQFAWPDERLRWKVDYRPDSTADYVVSLVMPDGSAPPPCELQVGSARSFYVTANAVYESGRIPKNFDCSPTGWMIPAAAIESVEGLRFLTGLDAELPLHLQKRVQRVSLQLTFICQITPKSKYDPAEALSVTAIAQDERGNRKEIYTFEGWTSSRKNGTAEKTRGGMIYCYDRLGLNRAEALMVPLNPKWDYQNQAWQCRMKKGFPEIFVAWIDSLPADVELHLDENLSTLLQNPIAASVRLDCQEVGIDWFDLQVVLDVSQTELTKEELKLLLNARGRFVRLGDKGWRRLEYNLTEEQDAKLAKLGLATNEFSAEPQRLHALQLADDAASELLPQKQFEQIRSRVNEIKMRVTPPVPDSMQAELRSYQLEGFHFLSYLATNRFGGILADDMGLGKTVQALTWLIWLRQQNGEGCKPVLVVCPKSVVDNWQSEAGRFAPALRVRIWRGRNGDDAVKELNKLDLFVINYAQLRAMDQTLAKVEWQTVILDEGQYIKNPDSQTSQAARALKSDHRLVLSGTPIENRLLDLWSLMAFAMPGMLGNRTAFTKNFGDSGDKLARSRLAARVRPFLLRRTKSQVATELPDRIEEDMLCEMEGEQQTLYRAELKRAQQMLLQVKTKQDLNEARFNFLTSLLRLRQICCHPGLVNPKLKGAESSKLEALLDLLEPLMEEGNKVLVFSQFVTMLDIVRKAVKEKGWQQFYLAGDTENRGDLVNKFQNAAGSAVFLISLKAGGFGLNLTAASYVVLFDPWWNPAVENQAIDRTHRIGQINKVIAYRLLIKDSIEGKIRALQKQKSTLAQDVLGEEGFASSLSLDDLKYLFSEDLNQ